MAKLNYNLIEHIHKFACWTAARASQERFMSSEVIIEAINSSGLKDIIDRPRSRPASEARFKIWHHKIAKKLIDSLGAKPATDFGRVAKIIAIYLKTAVLLPEGNIPFTQIMYPPIDSSLLNNLSQKMKGKDKFFSKYLSQIRWTKMNKIDHNELIKSIKAHKLHKPAFWMLEVNWENHR
jgi:hypothetical protein